MYRTINGLITDMGLKKSDLADRLGMTTITLNKRLEDETQFSIKEIKKLAAALGVNIIDIVKIIDNEQD